MSKPFSTVENWNETLLVKVNSYSTFAFATFCLKKFFLLEFFSLRAFFLKNKFFKGKQSLDIYLNEIFKAPINLLLFEVQLSLELIHLLTRYF